MNYDPKTYETEVLNKKDYEVPLPQRGQPNAADVEGLKYFEYEKPKKTYRQAYFLKGGSYIAILIKTKR